MVSHIRLTETDLLLCLTANLTTMIGHSKYAGEVRVSYHRDSNFKDIGSVINPQHASDKLRNILDLEFGSVEYREVAFVIFLNKANRIIGWSTLSIGEIGGCIMSVYEIARQALMTNATGVIVAHNHPSGNLSPSNPDIETTKKTILSQTKPTNSFSFHFFFNLYRSGRLSEPL